jgi:peroxiredoxin
MIATWYLLGCVLAPLQAPSQPFPSPANPRLQPHLSRSQELVYRGAYTEEILGDRTRHTRSYRVETRVFVLDADGKEAELAVFTVLKNKDGKSAEPPTVPTELAAVSVRLERIRVDSLGKLSADHGVSLSVPLHGVPTIECGILVEAPKVGRAGDESWEVVEDGRPVRVWQIAGSETVNGTACLKVVGVQQTDDWDRPTGERTAYRRTDTLWVTPRLGVACKVERVIEHKDSDRKEPSRRAVLRYDLESNMPYPGQLSEDRRAEIQQALAFRDAATGLLTTPTKYGQQLTTLLERINYHLDHQTPTPYRDAVVAVKRRVEAAKRGEPAPQVVENDPLPPTVAVIGQAAPDFLASSFTNSKATRLRGLQGKPILLVFYSPVSSISPDVLRYAERMNAAYGQKLTVIGMSVSDDEDKVKKQLVDLKLAIPVLHGAGLRVTYAVETTPKLVLIDANGIVRGDWLGWGQETADDVMAELKQWMK